MAYYATYMPDETGALQKVVINAGVGFCLPFYGTEAPPGTLACDGSEISREAYKELFQVLGTKAGAGDGVSTFNLPDFRGDFIRCVGGNAAALDVEQGDAIRDFNAEFGSDTSGTFTSVWGGGFGKGIPRGTNTCLQTKTVDASDLSGQYCRVQLRASFQVPTASETRPVNVALLWCIIYE